MTVEEATNGRQEEMDGPKKKMKQGMGKRRSREEYEARNGRKKSEITQMKQGMWPKKMVKRRKWSKKLKEMTVTRRKWSKKLKKKCKRNIKQGMEEKTVN